jgi:hypothetical protein
MPQVPTYGNGAPTERTRPVGGGSYRAPDQHAGDIMAGAVEGIGTTLGQMAQVADKQAAVKDEAYAKSLDSAYGEQQTALLYGPNGYLSQRGSHAIEGYDPVQQQLSQLRTDTLAKAQNERQRLMLTNSLTARHDSALQIVGQHSAKETQAFQDESSVDRIDGLLEEGKLGFGTKIVTADGRTVDAGEQKLHAAIGELQELSARRGDPADTAANNERKLTSSFYAPLVQRALESGKSDDLAQAHKIMEDHAADMTDSARLQLAAGLQHADREEQRQTAVDAYFTLGARTKGDAAGNPTDASSPLPDVPGSVVKKATGSMVQVVREEWTAAGLSPDEGVVFMSIESGGRNIRNLEGGSATGPFQFGRKTFFSVLPNGNINDPRDQAKAAALLYKRNAAYLTQHGIINPTPWQVYMAHQQGAGGSAALMKADPNKGAIQALEDAGVPNAAASITGNLPKRLRAQASTMTAGQFLSYWRDTYIKSGGNGARGWSAAVADTGVNALAGGPSMTGEDIHAHAMAQAHGDPKLAADIEEGIRTRFAQQDADRARIGRDLERQAQPYVQAEVPWDQMPGDLRSAITRYDPEYQTQWMKQDKANALAAANKAAETGNPVAMDALHAAYVANPRAFLDVPMSKFMGVGLGKAEVNEVLGWRSKAREALAAGSPDGRGPDHWTDEAIRKFAADRLVVAGLDPTPSMPNNLGNRNAVTLTQRNAERVAAFTGWMRRAVDIQRQNNGGKPVTDDQVRQLMEGALVTGAWKQPDPAHAGKVVAKKGFVFEARNQGADAFAHGMTVDVPRGDRAKIIANFVAANPSWPKDQPVPDEYISRTWYRLHVRGIPVPDAPTPRAGHAPTR